MTVAVNISFSGHTGKNTTRLSGISLKSTGRSLEQNRQEHYEKSKIT